MLITQDGQMTGAISGGCVEKEILKQSESVFKNEKAKIITYDGRYRLGCEGLIYILIEPFNPDHTFIEAFNKVISLRKPFTIEAYYTPINGEFINMGSVFYFSGIPYTVHHLFNLENNPHQKYTQNLPPTFRLLLFGNEHDSVHLCQLSALCGWQVEIFTSSPTIDQLDHFSMASKVQYIQPDEIPNLDIDNETAIVLMTHNYAKDLAYLLNLAKSKNKPCYIGVLGSKIRMHQLESNLFEQLPWLDNNFIDLLHGPAGLDIGSITPQEIAISIISEITQKVRISNTVLQI